jgi:acid phosphatase family membrane protein YuiD
MTTALGLLEGTSSTMFALALVLTLIVAYDATGVRLHAGALLLSSMQWCWQQNAACASAGWQQFRAAVQCAMCSQA